MDGPTFCRMTVHDGCDEVLVDLAAEQDSEACAAFASIMNDGEYSVFKVLKTYEGIEAEMQ